MDFNEWRRQKYVILLKIVIYRYILHKYLTILEPLPIIEIHTPSRADKKWHGMIGIINSYITITYILLYVINIQEHRLYLCKYNNMWPRVQSTEKEKNVKHDNYFYRKVIFNNSRNEHFEAMIVFLQYRRSETSRSKNTKRQNLA